MQSANSSEIAVIVVNYGTADLALKAAESALAYPAGGRAIEVHVVDNASPNGDAIQLAEEIDARGWQGRVFLYPEETNTGFGRGNNIALEALAQRGSSPDKVFLLNPDACLSNDAIGILASFLDAHSGAAAVGARLTDPNGVPTTACFRFPSIAGEFAEAASFGPLTRLLARWRIPLSAEHPTGPVDWVTGAAVMFRFDALRQVGFFDPGFFLYYDEVELMLRLHRAGWSCWHVAEAEVAHVEGAATDLRGDEVGMRRRPAYWYESRRLYSFKAFGRFGAIINSVAVMVGAALNHTISRVRGRKAWLPKHFMTDTWRIVLRPLLTGWHPE